VPSAENSSRPFKRKLISKSRSRSLQKEYEQYPPLKINLKRAVIVVKWLKKNTQEEEERNTNENGFQNS